VSKKQNQSAVKLILRTMIIQFTTTPIHITLFIFVVLLEALGLTARAITTKQLFDTVAEASLGNIEFMNCLVSVLIMGMVTIVQQFINGVKFFYWPVITDKASGINKQKLFKKVQCLSPEVFEDTNFLDDLNKAQNGVEPLTTVSLFILNIIFFDVTYAISMGGYLFYLNPILIITLALAFIPALISQIVNMKIFTKLEKDSAPLRRQCDYYKKAICDREYYKETRVLGAFHYFYDLFQNTLSLLLRKQRNIEKKTTVIKVLLNIVTFMGMGLSTYLLFISTMNGYISIGAFAAVFTTLGVVFDVMQSMMAWDVSGISRDMGKVYNFMNIMDYPERKGKTGIHDFSTGVVADNINFRYPNKSQLAINEVSLTISEGETIAIVGENGSGKSTLVRLLTGLYQPCQGKVTIGGLDTKDITPECIFKDISGVFQNYQKYKMTLLDNVVISDVGKDIDEKYVYNVLQQAGFNYNKDDIKLDTLLSPEFGGVDLSGGQWQRLALARGLYRQNNFIVLDEPTAAIDPIEEDKLFAQFKEMIKGKSAIIVTHRLGSTKLADRIIVMDKGRINDMGEHEQLLSKSGKYAEMWNAQAEWYQRDKAINIIN
jgi:ATP-binding cassette subfamily B protein